MSRKKLPRSTLGAMNQMDVLIDWTRQNKGAPPERVHVYPAQYAALEAAAKEGISGALSLNKADHTLRYRGVVVEVARTE